MIREAHANKPHARRRTIDARPPPVASRAVVLLADANLSYRLAFISRIVPCSSECGRTDRLGVFVAISLPMTTRIAVLGQGPAGCTAAYHLNRVAGAKVAIDLIGQDLAGHSSTYYTAGAPPIDVAATLITETYTTIHRMIGELGLTSHLLLLRPAMTVRRGDGQTGSLVLNEPLTILGYPLLEPVDKLRILGPLAALVAIGLLPGFDPMALASMAILDSGRSTARYVCRTMGKAVLDNLARLIEGLWLIPCEQIAEAHFKAWFSRPTARWSVLDQGLGAMWKAVVDTLNPPHRVITGADVLAVERAGSGYKVEFTEGGQRKQELYDALVIALPAPVIVRLAFALLSAQERTLLSTLGWVKSIHAVYKVKVPLGTPPEKGPDHPVRRGDAPRCRHAAPLDKQVCRAQERRPAGRRRLRVSVRERRLQRDALRTA